MNSTWMQGFGGKNHYLKAIYSALESGVVAKDVVCSITTGFRMIPSIRTSPALNPYHSLVADAGYGFDAVQGSIDRLLQGELIPYIKELLVFDLDTLRLTQEELNVIFELAVRNAGPDAFSMVEQSYNMNAQISEQAKQAVSLGQVLFGPEWETLRSRIENIQSIQRI